MASRTLASKIGLSVVAVCGMGFSLAQASDLNTYTLNVVVPKASATCASAAAHYSHLLSVAGKVSVTNTQCSSLSSSLYNMTLTYQAADQVIAYQASYGRPVLPTDSTPDDSSGIYNDLSSCNADLSNQSNAFARNSGLSVFTSYCSDDGSGFGSVTLRVVGIGQPTQQLYVLHAFDGGVASSSAMSDASRVLKSDGATVVKNDGQNIFYYAAAPSTAQMTPMGVYTSVSECQSQTSAAEKIMTAAGASSAASTCVVNNDGYTTVSLQVVSVGSSFMESEESYGGETYGSMRDCVSDVGRIDGLAQANNLVTYGEICSPGTATGSYEMTVYSHD